MAAGRFVSEKGNDTTAICREPIPAQKSCNGYRVYKTLAIVYGVFFFLIGALLLALGLWTVIIKSDFESILDVLTSPSILAIVVGGTMITTAIIGLIGSAVSNLWSLRVFLGIIIVVFIIQVTIGIVAFVHREQTVENIDKHLDFAITKYFDNKQVKYAVDKVQTELRCCGLNNLSDWTRNRFYACTGEQKYSCHVPDSCCKTYFEDCGVRIVSTAQQVQLQNKEVYIDGCRWQFLKWFDKYLDIIGATALGFAILHILGIFVVYVFISKVEDHQRLFKYRKRYYAN